jgi:hypothetical protein
MSESQTKYDDLVMLGACPLDTLGSALSHALTTDLPYLRFPANDPDKIKQELEGVGKIPDGWEARRPYQSEVNVQLFQQAVSVSRERGIDTVVFAYAVIVTHLDVSAIYFGKLPLAYMVNRKVDSVEGQKRFLDDLAMLDIASPSQANRYD